MKNLNLPRPVVAHRSTWIETRIVINRCIVLISSGVRTNKHMESSRVVVDPPRRINGHQESIVRSIRDFGVERFQIVGPTRPNWANRLYLGLCPDGWL